MGYVSTLLWLRHKIVIIQGSHTWCLCKCLGIVLRFYRCCLFIYIHFKINHLLYATLNFLILFSLYHSLYTHLFRSCVLSPLIPQLLFLLVVVSALSSSSAGHFKKFGGGGFSGGHRPLALYPTVALPIYGGHGGYGGYGSGYSGYGSGYGGYGYSGYGSSYGGYGGSYGGYGWWSLRRVNRSRQRKWYWNMQNKRRNEPILFLSHVLCKRQSNERKIDTLYQLPNPRHRFTE